MTKERQDLTEISPALARLRAAKGASARHHAMTTEDPEKAGQPNPEDTPETLQPETPQGAMGTVDGGNSSDPSSGDPKLEQPADGTDWKKRFGDQQTYIQQLKEERDAANTKAENADTPPVQLPKTDAELAKWKKTHPEQVDLILTLIGKQNEGTAEEVKKAREELAQIRNTTKSAELFGEVLKVHPDAGAIKKSPEWLEWFNEQTPATRALVESPNVTDIARGIGLYKADKGITATPKSTGKSEADAAFVSTRKQHQTPTGPKIWTKSEVSKLTIKQYAASRDEIKQAKAENRFDFSS